jgi:hypothetical protein
MLFYSSAVLLNARIKKSNTNGLPTRTQFQRFLSDTPGSLFKKLVISTPLLLQGLYSMNLAKVVPDSLKPQECKRLCLREPPPVLYVPEKDEVQEEVSKMKNLQIKMLIENDTTLSFPVWYDNGTKDVCSMHVTMVLDAIKKRGHFKDYNKVQKAYVEQKEAVRSVKAGLAFLDRASRGLGKLIKSSKKAKEAKAKSKEADGQPRCPKTR